MAKSTKKKTTDSDTLKRKKRQATSRKSPKTKKSVKATSGKSPSKKPVKAPVKKPVKATVKKPVKAPVKKPVKAPVKKPVKKPVKAPVKKPVKKPVKAPVKKPVKRKAPAKPVKRKASVKPTSPLQPPLPPIPEDFEVIGPEGQKPNDIEKAIYDQLHFLADVLMGQLGVDTRVSVARYSEGATDGELRIVTIPDSTLVLDIFILLQQNTTLIPYAWMNIHFQRIWSGEEDLEGKFRYVYHDTYVDTPMYWGHMERYLLYFDDAIDIERRSREKGRLKAQMIIYRLHWNPEGVRPQY